MKIFGMTECGSVKSNNEDCFLIDDKSFTSGKYEGSNGNVFCLFDGVDGANSGEVASSRSAYYFGKNFGNIKDMNENQLREYIDLINVQLIKYAQQNPQNIGMSTTLAGVKINKKTLMIFNVGDSRIYRLRDGELLQLSYDDNYLNLLKEKNEATEEDVEKYHGNHILTNCLGSYRFNSGKIHVQILENDLNKNDLIFICSGGVTDMLEDQSLKFILQEESLKPSEKGRVLQEDIEEKGAKDNYSFIIIEI